MRWTLPNILILSSLSIMVVLNLICLIIVQPNLSAFDIKMTIIFVKLFETLTLVMASQLICATVLRPYKKIKLPFVCMVMIQILLIIGIYMIITGTIYNDILKPIDNITVATLAMAVFGFVVSFFGRTAIESEV